MSLLRRLVSPVLDTAVPAHNATYLDDGHRWDVAINGVPFMFSVDPTPQSRMYRQPLIRETAQWQKPRYDNSTEPGEQTLDGWWPHSQHSFHVGAGQLYGDGATTSEAQQYERVRFLRSRGVDVWEPGKTTLLHDTDKLLTVASTSPVMACAYDGTTPIAIVGDGSTLKRVTGTASTSVTWGGTGNILSVTQDGTNYYAANATGIYAGTLAGGNGSLLWNTGSSKVVIAWVKQRLMGAIGASIYELVGTGPTLPTAKFTHPNSAWTWTAICEGPGAIYAAGYAGSSSAIYKFVLDSSGAVPTVSTGIVVLELPTGELVQAMASYLGTYLTVGTNEGVRVCTFNGTDLDMGTLSVEQSCSAVTAKGDSFYVGYTDPDYNDASGLARVNLGTEIAYRRFAWANDLRANEGNGSTDVFRTGTVVAAGLFAGRLAFLIAGVGLFAESATRYVSSGVLVTSRIRFGTTENKNYRYIRYRGEGSHGVIAVDGRIDTDTFASTEMYSMDLATQVDSGDIAILKNGNGQYGVLQFTLLPDTNDNTKAPVLLSYYLKAQPAPSKQRMLVIPCSLYDFEQDGCGHTFGHEGWALDRRDGLEVAENLGAVVSVEWLAGPAALRRKEFATIEKLSFEQPYATTPDSPVGGVLYVTLRTV